MECKLATGALSAALLLVGCGASTTTPSPSPTASATATPTAAATANPSAAPTPPATATPLAAIVIVEPAAGATVHSPMRVSGTANTFEAQFVLELRDAAGHVLSSQQVHATSGTGTRGSFDTMVSFSARGPATLVAYERSAKDGSPVNTVSVAITLA